MTTEEVVVEEAVNELLQLVAINQYEGYEATWAMPEDKSVGTDPRRIRVCREIKRRVTGPLRSFGLRPLDVSLVSNTNDEGETTQTFTLLVAKL